MTRYKPSALEWLTVVIMFPIILLTTGYQMFGIKYFTDPKVFSITTGTIFSVALVMWYVQRNMIVIISKDYAQLGQMWMRLWVLLLLDILMIICTMVFIFDGFDTLSILGYQLNREKFWLCTVVGIIVTLTGTTLCETEYTFKKWKESLAARELAELQYLQQEFENLIGQINPHFLFNNLNALSSLIGTDPKKAEYFLDELSKVYRYLMRNNEEGISSLSSELRFIYSYVELLKIRYNESVYLFDNTGKSYENYLLPSLSLQLLVENAVKHNIAKKDRPLNITISVDEAQRLVVENNLQRKSAIATSNKVGLQNISIKYKMLNQPGIIVDQDEHFFRVKLALLKNVSFDGETAISDNLFAS